MKKGRAVLIIILILIIINAPIIYALSRFLPYLAEDTKAYDDAVARVSEINSYIRQNKDAYAELSEYQMSFLSDDLTRFTISRDGDKQELRDTVFKYAISAEVFLDTEGKPCVVYLVQEDSCVIVIVYQKNVTVGMTDEPDPDEYRDDDDAYPDVVRCIGSDMYVSMRKVRD